MSSQAKYLEFQEPGTWFQLAIELNSSGEMIGDCGIHTLRDSPEQVELGITLAPLHQGKGYARETLTSVLNYVFGPLCKAQVITLTDPRNTSAIRLLKRLGMQQKELLERHLLVNGEWVDDVKYALSAKQWQKSTVQ